MQRPAMGAERLAKHIRNGFTLDGICLETGEIFLTELIDFQGQAVISAGENGAGAAANKTRDQILGTAGFHQFSRPLRINSGDQPGRSYLVLSIPP